uniref:GTPase n=1 Tax=Macrostomum lignano TaxID=282301 RepID=A0A1I8H8F1_9PLAT
MELSAQEIQLNRILRQLLQQHPLRQPITVELGLIGCCKSTIVRFTKAPCI